MPESPTSNTSERPTLKLRLKNAPQAAAEAAEAPAPTSAKAAALPQVEVSFGDAPVPSPAPAKPAMAVRPPVPAQPAGEPPEAPQAASEAPVAAEAETLTELSFDPADIPLPGTEAEDEPAADLRAHDPEPEKKPRRGLTSVPMPPKASELKAQRAKRRTTAPAKKRGMYLAAGVLVGVIGLAYAAHSIYQQLQLAAVKPVVVKEPASLPPPRALPTAAQVTSVDLPYPWLAGAEVVQARNDLFLYHAGVAYRPGDVLQAEPRLILKQVDPSGRVLIEDANGNVVEVGL